MISEDGLPLYHYVAAYLLACFAASAAVSLAFVAQGGDEISFGAVVLLPVVAVPIVISGALIGLPVHVLFFRSRAHVSVLEATAIGIGCGIGATIIAGLLMLDVPLTKQLVPFGALAGGIAGVVWWITILKPLNGINHG